MMHGHQAVVASANVSTKINEIIQPKPLLDPLNIAEWAVTLGAMHYQKEDRPLPGRGQEAAFVFTAAKDDQPILVARLDAPPWDTVPIGPAKRDCGHGRNEKGTPIQALPAPEGIWP